MTVLQHALPEYLKMGAPIHLNHDDGLFIRVKVDDTYKFDIDQAIAKGDLTGFSICGTCNFKPECDNLQNKCWKNVEDLRLSEISLVGRPANVESVIYN